MKNQNNNHVCSPASKESGWLKRRWFIVKNFGDICDYKHRTARCDMCKKLLVPKWNITVIRSFLFFASELAELSTHFLHWETKRLMWDMQILEGYLRTAGLVLFLLGCVAPRLLMVLTPWREASLDGLTEEAFFRCRKKERHTLVLMAWVFYYLVRIVYFTIYNFILAPELVDYVQSLIS